MKEYMKKYPEPVPIVGGAGTAALFHCNLLHASGHNLSAEDRWQIFFCFNQCKNRPADVENPAPGLRPFAQLDAPNLSAETASLRQVESWQLNPPTSPRRFPALHPQFPYTSRHSR